MNPWQDIAALVLVLAAALYVVRRLLQAGGRRRSAGCGGCSECASAVNPEPLVTIDPPKST
jgi:hypothetical protein